MKIIKPGQKPSNELKGKCRHCGCELECLTSEAKWLDEDRPGANDGCYTFICPTCGKLIYLNHKKRDPYGDDD